MLELGGGFIVCVTAGCATLAAFMFTPPHVFEQPLPAFDVNAIETPAYVIDLALLRRNLEKLAMVQREAGVKVLLALKGYSMFSTFSLVREYLSGCCASGLQEALLAHQEFGREVHVYAPAFKPHEIEQIIPIADHISFNSVAQWRRFRPMLEAARAAGKHAPSPGLRVNPEHSEVEVSLYDPCSPGCRLGIRADALEGEDLRGIEGLHFHALCEQGSDVLERVVGAVEQRFPRFLEQVRWVNMGGGHHISRSDYDVERLIRLLRTFKARWGKDHVYLEPGEAIGLNTGYLIGEVQDIVGARKSSIAISSPPPTQLHALHRSNPESHRTSENAFDSAIRLHRCLEAAERELDRPDAAQRLHAEAKSLREWALKEGCLLSTAELSATITGLDELEGASEHDVCLNHDQSRVLKWTKPPNFGARGSVQAYLENLLACHLLFGLDWRFEAVVEGPDGLRVLSSQPFIIGENPSIEQIDVWFAALGFSKLRENTYIREDGLQIADARPDNILLRPDGSLVPIDIHILGITFDAILESVEKSAQECEAVLPTAILDLSATAHMPDALEMPYRPHIFGAGEPGEYAHEYLIGGMTCLAGDVLRGYSFPQPLQPGQRLVFADMAHYTMVKTTTFNGVPHPDIAIYDPATGEYRVVRRFGYEDFKNKLS
jgi:carboxynorspermidine decarboxylase